ncbi:helix-turn-helix domain-containing protein [Burkholderia sp. Bp9143]|uniref:helix-turn-helix domain-containing protein n=1 Tax=Burkholderia sp. Bp9143 TaxID=2184574 RepID=UPI000F5B67D2|nr:helix-turn-helix domain-containing protein [Burkholderia sp. Bp9143]RQR22043.1 helix-turn-helix domain-containing protein [Burkholderia sp. Bp9143]
MHFDLVASSPGSASNGFDPEVVEAAFAHSPVHCRVDYSVDRHSRVTGYRGVQLGAVDVSCYEGVGYHRGDRPSSHVLADRRDDFLLTIPLRARIDMQQGEASQALSAGAFCLLATSRPFRASVRSLHDGEVFSALHLRIGGSMLRQHIANVEMVCGQALPLKPGTGSMLRRVCQMAIEEGRWIAPHEVHGLATMLVTAVTNAIGDLPDKLAPPASATMQAHQRIARQAAEYIEAHLSDVDLDTEAVASHCRVSKRYMQTVFAERGQTVRDVIRELRLLRCREALRNKALQGQPVALVAYSWGFTDLPNFCRAYKARFGVQPSRDRVAVDAR